MKGKYIIGAILGIFLINLVSAASILPNEICWDFYNSTGNLDFCIKGGDNYQLIPRTLVIDGDLNLTGSMFSSSPVKFREGIVINNTLSDNEWYVNITNDYTWFNVSNFNITGNLNVRDKGTFNTLNVTDEAEVYNLTLYNDDGGTVSAYATSGADPSFRVGGIVYADALTDFTLDIVNGNILTTERAYMGNGTESAPSFTFFAETGYDADTGMWRPAEDNIGFSTGGNYAFRMDNSEIESYRNIEMSNYNVTADYYFGDFDGVFNWTTLTNWLSFDGSTLSFNDTKLNTTISQEGVRLGFNSTYNATYHAKADYQFTDNNFNGSGDLTTTGLIQGATSDFSESLVVGDTSLSANDFVRMLGATGTGYNVGKGIDMDCGKGAEGQGGSWSQGTAGGATSITSGQGGNSGDGSSGAAGGGGGNFILQGGSGGVSDSSTSGNTGGTGGYFSQQSGAGGIANGAGGGTNAGGGGGVISLIGGTGGRADNGATNNGGNGGGATMRAGNGGIGNGSGGDGGTATLQAGAGANANGDGGDVIIRSGAKHGSGTDGAITFKISSNEIAEFLNDGSGLRFLDNKKVIYGTGDDAWTTWDGTNIIFNQSGAGVWTFYNSSGLGTIRYGSALTSTQVNNDSDVLETYNLGKDLFNGDGTINHVAFGDCYRQIEEKDYSNCWTEVYRTEYCYNYSNEEINYFYGCYSSPMNNNEYFIESIINYEEEVCGTKLSDVVDLTCESAKHRQALALLNQNSNIYPNLTDFDTGIVAENIYTQSKVINLIDNYALKFLNASLLDNKYTHKNKEVLPQLPVDNRNVLNIEDRIIDLEGAFSDHMTCMYLHKKYNDYRDCMLDINPKEKIK